MVVETNDPTDDIVTFINQTKSEELIEKMQKMWNSKNPSYFSQRFRFFKEKGCNVFALLREMKTTPAKTKLPGLLGHSFRNFIKTKSGSRPN